VAAEILGPGAAAAVAVVPRHRLDAARLELAAEHVALTDDVFHARNLATVGQDPYGPRHDPSRPPAKRNSLLRARGLPDWDRLDDSIKSIWGTRFVVGDDAVAAEQLHALLGLGLDGFTFNMPVDGWDLDAVRHAGQLLQKVVG
jgi:alkanesulfonate monooxygenase SsuD/methylene tetrahydromethanopterin reductase-like flavin-dependent oxidoreductase (luciferase family)